MQAGSEYNGRPCLSLLYVLRLEGSKFENAIRISSVSWETQRSYPATHLNPSEISQKAAGEAGDVGRASTCKTTISVTYNQAAVPPDTDEKRSLVTK